MPNEQPKLQDELMRQSEHVRSTVELLVQVLENERIPTVVALSSLCEVITMINWREARDCAEFFELEKKTQNSMHYCTPVFMNNKFTEYFKTLGPEQKIREVLMVLTIGPKCGKIKDGKLV